MTDWNLNRLLPREEIAAFHAALAMPATRCIRLRPDRSDENVLPMAVEAVPWFDRGRLIVDPGLRPSQSLHYAAADYYIQDAGSMLALALLDAQPHESICDLCAAPGGKASGIGESLSDRGFLLANEVINSRTTILRYALSRTGNPRYAVTQQDPDEIAGRFSGLFDAVLVDAPCSGQAMVGRGKRDENAFDPKQVEHSARRQQRILLAACKLLKPGGRLIYSTCTFAMEENEAQMRFLQDRFPGMWEPIQSKSLERWASPIEQGCYRLWPHRDATAGAFAAGMILKAPILQQVEIAPKSTRNRSNKSFPQSRSRDRLGDVDELNQFGQLHRMQLRATESGDVLGIADDVPEEIVKRIDDRELLRLATKKASICKPEYSLAMLGTDWFEPARQTDVTDGLARKYMLGEAFAAERGPNSEEISSSRKIKMGSKQPWTVLTWQKKALGWAKFAQNRVNNHLPKLAILPICPVE